LQERKVNVNTSAGIETQPQKVALLEMQAKQELNAGLPAQSHSRRRVCEHAPLLQLSVVHVLLSLQQGLDALGPKQDTAQTPLMQLLKEHADNTGSVMAVHCTGCSWQ